MELLLLHEVETIWQNISLLVLSHLGNLFSCVHCCQRLFNLDHLLFVEPFFLLFGLFKHGHLSFLLDHGLFGLLSHLVLFDSCLLLLVGNLEMRFLKLYSLFLTCYQYLGLWCLNCEILFDSLFLLLRHFIHYELDGLDFNLHHRRRLFFVLFRRLVVKRCD